MKTHRYLTQRKALKCLIGLMLAAGLSTTTVSAQGDTPGSANINFGAPFGYHFDSNLPTYAISSGGPVTAGDLFYWTCLNENVDPPFGSETYTVGTSSTVLSGGIWTGLALDTRESITSAVANMYFNNKADIFAASEHAYSGAGFHYQTAVWYITGSYYEGGVWSGVLDGTDITNIIAWGETQDWGGDAGTPEGKAGIAALLNTALMPSSGGTVFWATASDPNDQPVALFLIPEPGTMTLMGMAGMVGLILLRRKTAVAKALNP